MLHDVGGCYMMFGNDTGFGMMLDNTTGRYMMLMNIIGRLHDVSECYI